ncbi:MAG: hypothetical protein ACREQ7_13160 [Candidatus Binatia bacterium]
MLQTVGCEKDELRAQHYTFANYTLREQAFEATTLLLNALANGDRGYVRDQWFSAIVRCRMADLPSEVTWFPMEDIRISVSKRGKLTCYVISMPEPKLITEAFFIGIVKTSSEVLKYYTLELGLEDDGTAPTVFCEWTADGSHLTHGDGPPPTVEEFSEAIFRHLKA